MGLLGGKLNCRQSSPLAKDQTLSDMLVSFYEDKGKGGWSWDEENKNGKDQRTSALGYGLCYELFPPVITPVFALCSPPTFCSLGPDRLVCTLGIGSVFDD